jgi:O-antigen ligase
MRKAVWVLLLLYVFTIPWEYSLDLGVPFGNIARIFGVALLIAALPAMAQASHFRTLGALQWLTLALFLWLTCTCLWSPDISITWAKLRGYVQEMMIVWLLWEFADTPRDLQAIVRAWLAGSTVLAALTIANSWSAEAIAAGQIRFTAIGVDPNDAARFLDLGFPLAALLMVQEVNWPARMLAVGYFPLGIAAVLLTASRGGFVAALVAVLGCAIILQRESFRSLLAACFALPIAGFAAWHLIPRETLNRIATIDDQIYGGDLNQRLNIWAAGWRAFASEPFFGHGAGSFVSAAGLASIDTAHNTALSILVEAGICGFLLTFAIVTVSTHSVLRMRGTVRMALLTLITVWVVSSLVGTVIESRTTWLMFGTIALAARFTTRQETRRVRMSVSTDGLPVDTTAARAQ